MSSRIIRHALALSVALAATPLAWSADAPTPQGVVSLSSSATLEVTRDLLSVRHMAANQ